MIFVNKYEFIGNQFTKLLRENAEKRYRLGTVGVKQVVAPNIQAANLFSDCVVWLTGFNVSIGFHCQLRVLRDQRSGCACFASL